MSHNVLFSGSWWKNKRLKLKMLRYDGIPVSTSSLTTVNRDIKDWLFDWLVDEDEHFYLRQLAYPENTSSRLMLLCTPTTRRSCMLEPLKPRAESLLTNDSMTSLSVSVTLFDINIILVNIAGFFNLFPFSRCVCTSPVNLVESVEPEEKYFTWNMWTQFRNVYWMLHIKLYWHALSLHHISWLSIIVHVEEPTCVKQEPSAVHRDDC